MYVLFTPCTYVRLLETPLPDRRYRMSQSHSYTFGSRWNLPGLTATVISVSLIVY